jgi:flagellar hook-associated protein 3
MVNVDFPFAGSFFSRVSTGQNSSIVLANMSKTQQDLLNLQEQLSTGQSINVPSDNPVGADRIMNYLTQISKTSQYETNIQAATGRLNLADSSLQSATDVITQAQQIYQEQRGGSSDAQSRLQAADSITQLLQQAVGLANTQFEGTSLFGGSKTNVAPFQIQGGGVVFNGNYDELNTAIADGTQMVTNVTAQAFGGLSDEIRGLDPVTQLPIDFRPRASLSTQLSDLNSGRGVALGSIQVNGATSATINLGDAKSISDVIALINNAGTGVTASLNTGTNTIDLTSGTAFSIQEVANGTTAGDLGIAVSGGPGTVAGAPLKPALTLDTQLGDLFGGAGVDPSGLIIANATSGGTLTATLGPSDFAPTNTIGQLLNAINGSGTEVVAQLNSAGTGIDVVSKLSGGRLTISENGGTTAATLGLLSTLGRANLTDLNNGLGLGTVPGPDIQITKKDGTTVLLDLDNAQTVNDLVNTINQQPGLTAALVGNQLQITDTTPGTGTFSIQNYGGSTAADTLGISGSVTGAGPQTITSAPLASAGVQTNGIFTALIRLRDALSSNNTGAMDVASGLLNQANEKILDSRGDIGARTQTLTMTTNRLDLQKTELQKLRSDTQDVDLAAVATQFSIEQNVLQASIQSAAQILQTTVLSFMATPVG